MTSIVVRKETNAPKKSSRVRKATAVDAVEAAPICSTRILCFDARGDSKKHEIEWYGDRFVCHGCSEADERSTKNAALAALGGRVYWGEEETGCEALLTLCKLVPYINQLDNDDRLLGNTIKPGPARDLWYHYETNKLLKAVLAEKKKRDLKGKEHVHKAVMKAAVSCARPYFDDDEAEGSMRVIWNVSLDKMPDYRVAWWSSDVWRVPLAPDWYDSVYARCKGSIGGHFVCGIAEDGTIWAIDEGTDGRMLVRAARQKGKKLYWL